MTWNPNIPDLSNNISADYPDIKENLNELMLGMINRPTFTYNGGSSAATVNISGGYYCCQDKFSYWASELTSAQAAGGTPTANIWYYLYLDYSAITSGTVLTNSEMIWSTTVPTYSHTYRGFYNGNDRCIFACMANSAGNNFDSFTHSGGYVNYDDGVLSVNSITPSDTWTDGTLEIPGFCTLAQITSVISYADTNSVAYIRTNGQTGTVGHRLGNTPTSGEVYYVNMPITTDSSGKIEVKWFPATAGNTIAIYTQGWHFPVGM